jgi:hypothetical protein
MSASERRRFPRFPFHSQGLLTLAGQAFPGTVLDVSAKGVLFSVEALPEVAAGADCGLEIMQAGEPEFRTSRAQVAYRRERLLGVEFLDLCEEGHRFLQRVIDMNLGVETMLERGLQDMLAVPAAAADTV